MNTNGENRFTNDLTKLIKLNKLKIAIKNCKSHNQIEFNQTKNSKCKSCLSKKKNATSLFAKSDKKT